MTTEHDNDQTPADRPTETIPAPTGTPATSAPEPEPAPEPALGHMATAARLDALEKLVADLTSRVNASHEHVLAVGAEIAPAVVDLQGIVHEHGDVLEDLIGKVGTLEAAAAASAPPRGQMPRRLPAPPAPGTTAASSPGTTTPAAPVVPASRPVGPRPPLFPGIKAPAGVGLKPGEEREETFEIDPRLPGSHVRTLESGGEVEFRVRAPSGGAGVTRGGRPGGQTGTRRG